MVSKEIKKAKLISETVMDLQCRTQDLAKATALIWDTLMAQDAICRQLQMILKSGPEQLTLF